MSVKVLIPQVGNEVEEVTIVSWLVEDGAAVRKGQEVLEIETGKAVFTVEAPADGILRRGPFDAGDVVKVLTPVATIEEEVRTATPDIPRPQVAPPPVRDEPVEVSTAHPRISPRARRLAEAHQVDITTLRGSGPGGRILERDVQQVLKREVRATPVARRMAADHGVDLTAISGTGPGGTITKRDVEQALETVPNTPEPEPSSEEEILQKIPLHGTRKIIAERMTLSVRTAPQVTLVTEVDATEFVQARRRLKAAVEDMWGFAPGYLDLLALIVVRGLQRYPYMNARLRENTIEYLRPVHLGIAVDTERGLLVPVIKNAHTLTLRELGQRFRDLVEQARSGRITPDNLSGSTFTLTSLGTYDIDAFTPIINPPEAAILGVGRIREKPVAHEGKVVVRQMWTLSLVFDHRLVDGAPAARFLQHIKRVIEEPYLLLAMT